MRKKSDSKYYNREVKRLKLKVSRAYNKRKLGGTETTIQAVAGSQEQVQETLLRLVLQDEGKCRTEFNKCVKRRKRNMENIPATKDCNGRLVTHSTETAATLIPFMFLYLAANETSRKYVSPLRCTFLH
jgi:hypothetical protein